MPNDTQDEKTKEAEAAAAAQATQEAAAAAAAEEAARAAAQPTPVPARHWALGNHQRQVALAGLTVADPAFVAQPHTPADWQTAIDKYLASPRV